MLLPAISNPTRADQWFAELRHCQRIWHYVRSEQLCLQWDNAPCEAEAEAEYTFDQGIHVSQTPTLENGIQNLAPVFCITVQLRNKTTHKVHFKAVAELLTFIKHSVQSRLGDDFSEDLWKKFNTEVEQSTRLAAYSIAACRAFWRQIELANQSLVDKPNSIWEMLDRNLVSWRMWDQVASFDGHPYHPGSKCKVGLDDLFVQQTAPEFDPAVQIVIAAVRHEWIHISVSKSFSPVIKGSPAKVITSLFNTDILKEWVVQLGLHSVNPEEYVPLPIHPANLEKVKLLFDQLLRTNALILSGMPSVHWYPSMSYRTMYETSSNEKQLHGSTKCKETSQESEFNHYQWKLPVPVQATSLERYVSPVEANDSPILSDMLHNIFSKESHFNNTFFIMPEPVGVYLNYRKAFDGNSEKPFEYANGRYLSFLLREYPRNEEEAQTEQYMVPLAGLFCRDEIARNAQDDASHKPCDANSNSLTLEGEPTFVTLLKKIGHVNNPEHVEKYFAQYVDVVLEGQLGIWLRYSVVFEAHQQNTVLGLSKSDGQLMRTTIRDLCGGMCAVRQVLHSLGYQEYLDMLHERQDYVLDAAEDDTFQYCLGSFEHTTIKSHLLPLAKILGVYFSAFSGSKSKSLVDQSKLYDLLVQCIARKIKNMIDIREAEIEQMKPHAQELWRNLIRETRRWLLGPKSQFKCLMLMRCLATKDEFYVHHRNLLASFADSQEAEQEP